MHLKKPTIYGTMTMGWITHQEWSALNLAIHCGYLPTNARHIYRYRQMLIETILEFCCSAQLPGPCEITILLTQELNTTIGYYWLVAIAS